MQDVLKLLRYNTGTDKKAFIDFKDNFNAVIFNATIVAYSGSAVADLVSVHKNRFIIDPQTHIFQHDTKAIKTEKKVKNKNGQMFKTGQFEVKKSVEKYLKEMPDSLVDILIRNDRPITIDEIIANKEELAESVYKFQTTFIDNFIEKKEYNKYLDFVKAKPEPRLLIAPYFMIKNKYSEEEMTAWFSLNKEMLQIFSTKHNDKSEVAAQLVLDRKILTRPNFIQLVSDTYIDDNCQYVFIWIDDFNSFDASPIERKAFYDLLGAFKSINKKPIMAYGGYDSIFLCHNEIQNRLYGVAQSVGYGEAREITPVGGGMPVNKYYFLPIHQRMNFGTAAAILTENGFFSADKTPQQHATDYYHEICNCKQCKEIIKNNIHNFNQYNESTPFKFGKSEIMRHRPTTDASLIAAKHFLWCKIEEWRVIKKNSLATSIDSFLSDVKHYASDSMYESIRMWCELYAK